jgi:hypothetical protein
MIQSTCQGRRIAVLALYCFLPGTTASAFDNKDVIKQARNAYYSIQDQGSIEFQCVATPNWEKLLQAALKANPSGVGQVVIKLKKINFIVSVAKNESAKITHNAVPADNDKQAEGLKQIYSGMEQMVRGFFDTWSTFMKYPPLPVPDGEYQLREQGGQWDLTYRDGTADVATIMDKDFAVRELKVSAPEFLSTIRPQFTRSNAGFLLTGYQGDYRSKSPNANDTTQLQISINYQQVSGFQLPKTLDLDATYAGARSKVEVTFSGCTATKR